MSSVKKTVINEILQVICDVWENNISRDYDKGILLEEDTLKCAFYYHLRRKLGTIMKENNLCIFTEYQGSEFKNLKYRPDMVIVKMKDVFDDEYLINNVKETIVAIEFKFQDKYGHNSIYKDCDKIKDYVKRINDDCYYVLAAIQEVYNPNPYWLDNRQANNWAKGKVTELVASYKKDSEELEFLHRCY